MELETLITVVTFFVTLVMGVISKKNPALSNKLIPIQNLAVGVIVAIVEWIITKNFSTAIALSGLVAGSTYDIVHNLEKLIKGE